jgi:NTP pyrophosphatase (non-canonical NTP hydrolase)
MTLKELQARCKQQADDLGWNTRVIPIPEMIALIHSEASEALESYRNKEPISWSKRTDGKPSGDSEINVLDPAIMKPEGIASEFADVIIRIGHYAQLLGIDLEYEIDRKLKYNMSRGYRHGGKLA